MLINIALLIIGLALLVWSADRFTDGAAAIARNFGVSPLIVGLTIIAIGSSAPEILVSITAAIDGTPKLAVGNAIGSNIANIAFVVGVTALITPLHVESNILRREFPVLFFVTALAGFLMFDGELTVLDGVLLLSTLGIYILWLVWTAKQPSSESDHMLEEIVEELPELMSNGKATLFVLGGGVLLAVSSKILVYSATNISALFGVSELIIGLTVVAIGTSLPELAASLAGVLKKEHEMAIGNVIGSNIFNLLAVLGIPGILTQVEVEQIVVYRDYTLMAALTVALFLMAGLSRSGKVSRAAGFLLVLTYIIYTTYIVVSTLNAEGAPAV